MPIRKVTFKPIRADTNHAGKIFVTQYIIYYP